MLLVSEKNNELFSLQNTITVTFFVCPRFSLASNHFDLSSPTFSHYPLKTVIRYTSTLLPTSTLTFNLSLFNMDFNLIRFQDSRSEFLKQPPNDIIRIFLKEQLNQYEKELITQRRHKRTTSKYAKQKYKFIAIVYKSQLIVIYSKIGNFSTFLLSPLSFLLIIFPFLLFLKFHTDVLIHLPLLSLFSLFRFPPKYNLH